MNLHEIDPTNDTVIIQLLDTLKGKMEEIGKELYAYSVNARYGLSLQSLLMADGDRPLVSYQDRNVNEKTYSITIYTRHNNGSVMGQATKNIDPLSPFPDQIHAAYESALLVNNTPYDLPEPPEKGYPDVETADREILTDPHKAMESMKNQAIKAAESLADVKVNSAEIYVNLQKRYTKYSTGVELKRDLSDVYFEAAMEKLPGPNVQEVHQYKKGITLSDIDIPAILKDMREESLALDTTSMPRTSESAVILVKSESFAALLDSLINQLSAEAEYNQNPHILPGDTVINGDGLENNDALNLTLDPYIPVMANSTPYTQEGLPAVPRDIIKNNVVEAQIIGNRIGQYLKKEPNGIMGNMIVAPGSKSRQELIESVDECLEVLSFSSLLINPRTLTYSSEIKLARMYKNGKPAGMIKGGILSGDFRQNLAGLRLSEETIIYNQVADSWHPSIGYRGPAYAMFRSGVKIAGED